jgi:hypothetical protein
MNWISKILSGNGKSFVIPANEGVGKAVITITEDTTLTAEDSGKLILVATDALTISLPATAKGLIYHFRNSGATTNNIITVSPVAADGIAGTITLAASVVVLDGTVNKDIVNTKGTSQAGDSVTLEGTGVTGTKAWFATKASGIWAQGA